MATPTLGPAMGPGPQPDNITLRIVILAHGNRAEDDLYLVLSLDTTIAQLKQRIQESLPQHPAPGVQRLIYHGRPLLDGTVSLRQVLRIETRTASSSHVLHLVIRDTADANTPVPSPAPAAHQAGTPTPVQTLPLQAQMQLPPGIPNFDHRAMHNQLHNIQHQLHHAQALNRANQARLHAQQALFHAQHPPQRQGDANETSQSQSQPQPQDQGPSAPLFMHAQPGVRQAPPTPHRPNVNITRLEERIGPNGEHIRTTTSNNGSSSMTFRITGLNVPHPIERPSSAPGSSPSAPADPANRAANPAAPNIQIHAQPPNMPLAFPFPSGLQLPFPVAGFMPPPVLNSLTSPPSNSSPPETMVWLLSSPEGPQGLVFAPGHGLFGSSQPPAAIPSSAPQGDAQPPPTQTVPYANIPPTPTVTPGQQAHPPVRSQQTNASTSEADGQGPPPPQPGARPQRPVLGQPQPAAAPAPAQQAQARPNRNEENEMLQLIISRGWLFLRLYMFIYVLSESGTLRRMMMLSCAIVFCLLPRNNPATQIFQVARRHFDNLIGPPPLPERLPQQAQDGQDNNRNVQGAANQTQPQAGTDRGSRRRGPAMPTPEEAARRLLEQQNRRNPNPVLHALQSIEQGVVLFLASLVPGLGERHVQAREQARRILEEEDRRIREERERATAQQRPSHESNGAATETGSSERKEAGPLPESWSTSSASNNGEASSSGISRNAGNDESSVRIRNTGA